MESFEVGLPEYLAAGGNRHPSAADWDRDTGLLAFGTDRNIALWHPEVRLDFFFVSSYHIHDWPNRKDSHLSCAKNHVII